MAELNTCSEVISLSKKFEEDGAKIYEGLAQRYPDNKDTWLSYAKENRRNAAQIERAYYGVITDAIEGCFAFKLDPDKYVVKTTLPAKASYSDVVNELTSLEDVMAKFYSDAAEQGEGLMADVPRTFAQAAKKRNTRKRELMELLERMSR